VKNTRVIIVTNGEPLPTEITQQLEAGYQEVIVTEDMDIGDVLRDCFFTRIGYYSPLHRQFVGELLSHLKRHNTRPS
jgi:hypothetical protein